MTSAPGPSQTPSHFENPPHPAAGPASANDHRFPPSNPMPPRGNVGADDDVEEDGGHTTVDEFSVLKEAMGARPGPVQDGEAGGNGNGNGGGGAGAGADGLPFVRPAPRGGYHFRAPPPISTADPHRADPGQDAGLTPPLSSPSPYSPPGPLSHADSRTPLTPTAPYRPSLDAPDQQRPQRHPGTSATRSQQGLEEDGYEDVFGTPPKGAVGRHRPRAIVRIERDFTAGGATTGRVQFWDGWLEELEGRITPLQLQNTLNELNAVLASAYDPYQSIFDNLLSVLTFYLSPHVVGTHYKREMRKFKEIIDRENQQVYNPAGLHILHPRKVAFLFLEIEYY